MCISKSGTRFVSITKARSSVVWSFTRLRLARWMRFAGLPARRRTGARAGQVSRSTPSGIRSAVNPSAEIILSEHQTDPETYAAPLAKKLTEAGAGGDAELVATARALMELLDQPGAKSGKYNVTVKDSKGVQVGDGNLQVNKF